ncbi:DUF1661 domain-containing protein [Porphyromonas gulae]|nr:DUF1661 domain-containing protein [Porphyromonas gulae]
MARKIFTCRTGTKKISRHVFQHGKQLFSRTKYTWESAYALSI